MTDKSIANFCIDCEPADLGRHLYTYVPLPSNQYLESLDLTLKIDYHGGNVTMVGRGTIGDDDTLKYEHREVINISGLDEVIKFIEECCLKSKCSGYRELKRIQGRRNLRLSRSSTI